jgi:hypothetical protein
VEKIAGSEEFLEASAGLEKQVKINPAKPLSGL